MAELSEDLLDAVHEIRDLIRLMAEPQVAERDQKRRMELRRIVGKSLPKAKAIFLMDGSRTQAAIHRESGLHKGDLSALVKHLGTGGLLSGETKEPRLSISIPSNFFETGVGDE